MRVAGCKKWSGKRRAAPRTPTVFSRRSLRYSAPTCLETDTAASSLRIASRSVLDAPVPDTPTGIAGALQRVSVTGTSKGWPGVVVNSLLPNCSSVD